MKLALFCLALFISNWAFGQGTEWSRNLPSFFHTEFLSLALWQWFGLVFLLLIAYVIGVLVTAIIGKLLRVQERLHSALVTLGSVVRARQALRLFVATLVFLNLLHWLDLPENLYSKLGLPIWVIQIILGTWLSITAWEVLCDVYSERANRLSPKAASLLWPFARKFGRFIVVIVGGVVLISALGFNVMGIIAGLGIGGVALALAAKDSVENLFGTLTVLLDMPFVVGDWIKVDKVDGIVEEINLRSTRIRTWDDSLITLPNSNLIKASVENLGLRRYRRLRTNLVLPTDTPWEKIESFCTELRQLVGNANQVYQEKSYVRLFDMVETGILIQVTCYFEVANLQEELIEREKFFLKAFQLAESVGISLGGGRVNVPTAPEPSQPSN